jgi:hypothetical protein
MCFVVSDLKKNLATHTDGTGIPVRPKSKGGTWSERHAASVLQGKTLNYINCLVFRDSSLPAGKKQCRDGGER